MSGEDVAKTETISELALASELMRRDVRLSPAARLVGIELIAAIATAYAGEAAPKHIELAHQLGLAENTVKRAMRQLRGAGYFDVAKSSHANRYRLRGVSP